MFDRAGNAFAGSDMDLDGAIQIDLSQEKSHNLWIWLGKSFSAQSFYIECFYIRVFLHKSALIRARMKKRLLFRRAHCRRKHSQYIIEFGWKNIRPLFFVLFFSFSLFFLQDL